MGKETDKLFPEQAQAYGQLVGFFGGAERELQQKRARIRQYLTEEGGMDFLLRTWDENKWEHIGDDGSLKAVYRPRSGTLQQEGLCLRRNVSDKIINPIESAAEFREETKLLERIRSPHFVRVYGRAPVTSSDREGIGDFDYSRHWELVDFVDGLLVDRVVDRKRGVVVWPERLTPATRLGVLLAACHCEHDATNLTPPVYLTDLKTDAFKLHQNGVVRMIDVQHHSEAIEYSTNTIAIELGRLCLELFPGRREYSSLDIQNAIRGNVDLEWDRNNRKWNYSSTPRPYLIEILRQSELPGDVQVALADFLEQVKLRRLKFDEVSMDLARRILPIMQRLEREEAAARGEEIVRDARKEAGRGVEVGMAAAEKQWREVAGEMAEDAFAVIGFRNSGGNEIAAAAAFEFRAEIGDGRINKEMFMAMMKEINGIVRSYEAQLGKPTEQKQAWLQAVDEMSRNKIAETAFDTTKSRIAAAAAYRFRDGILRAKDQGASFKQMMRQVNGAVEKYRK